MPPYAKSINLYDNKEFCLERIAKKMQDSQKAWINDVSSHFKYRKKLIKMRAGIRRDFSGNLKLLNFSKLSKKKDSVVFYECLKKLFGAMGISQSSFLFPKWIVFFFSFINTCRLYKTNWYFLIVRVLGYKNFTN